MSGDTQRERDAQTRSAAEARAIYEAALKSNPASAAADRQGDDTDTELTLPNEDAETMPDQMNYEADGTDEEAESGLVSERTQEDILFVNRTNLDESDVRRLVEHIFDSKKGVKGYRMFLLLFGILVCVYAAYSIIQGLTGEPLTYVLTGTFLLVMGGIMVYMARKGVVDQTYKRTLRNAQSFMTPRTYHFYAQDFSQTSESQSFSVNWSETSGWAEDDFAYYILIGQSYAIVHKRGFTVGEEADFRSYLIEKAGEKLSTRRLP